MQQLFTYHLPTRCQVLFQVPRTQKWSPRKTRCLPSQSLHSSGGARQETSKTLDRISSRCDFRSTCMLRSKQTRHVRERKVRDGGASGPRKDAPVTLKLRLQRWEGARNVKSQRKSILERRNGKLKGTVSGKHYALLKRWRWPEGSSMCPVIFKFRIEVHAWREILIFPLCLSGLGKLYIFKVEEKRTFLNTQWESKWQWQLPSLRNLGNLFFICWFRKFF